MKQLVIDPAHTDLGFKIRHLMVSNVKGTLTDYSGGMKYTMDDMSDAEIRFEADVKSISTGNPDRDTHLNGEDFFNTERFPKIYFESTSINLNNNVLKGQMTIKDTTKEIVLGNIGKCMGVIPNTKNLPMFQEDVFGDGLFYENLSKIIDYEFVDKIIYKIRDTI